MSNVCHLLIQKHDNSALLFTLEQLGSRSGAYSVSLDDHPESFKRIAASPLQSRQAVVVFLAFGYDVP